MDGQDGWGTNLKRARHCLDLGNRQTARNGGIGGDTSYGGLREITFLADGVNQMKVANNSSAFESGHSWRPDIGR